MIAFTGAQLVLAAFVVALAVSRIRVLLFVAPLDRRAFLARLAAVLAERGAAGGAELASACRPAWIAVLADRALRVAATEGNAAGVGELGEAGLELSDAASKGLRALRVLASMATAAGLLGAILELQAMVAPDRGLRALARGLVERTALEGGMLAMALGVATAIVALAAQRMLVRAATGLVEDLKAVSAVVERALAPEQTSTT